MPLAALPGNKELDIEGLRFPSRGAYAHKPHVGSGGECGVPFAAHFRQAGERPWRAWSQGLVRFVAMSTESPFGLGSEQRRWVEVTLPSSPLRPFPPRPARR